MPNRWRRDLMPGHGAEELLRAARQAFVIRQEVGGIS